MSVKIILSVAAVLMTASLANAAWGFCQKSGCYCHGYVEARNDVCICGHAKAAHS